MTSLEAIARRIAITRELAHLSPSQAMSQAADELAALAWDETLLLAAGEAQ